MTLHKVREMYRLKDVIRFNCRKHLQNESVAEHSYYVAIFTMLICDEYKVDEEIKNRAIQKALLHDLSEIDLNDITYNVKEKLNLRPLLKKYEDEFYESYYPEYAEMMKDDSAETIDGLIWRFADALSVLQFCINEKDLGNNDCAIDEICKNTVKRLNSMQSKLCAKLNSSHTILSLQDLSKYL